MLKAEAELKRQWFKEDCPTTRVPKQDSRPISMRKTSVQMAEVSTVYKQVKNHPALQ
ncbi:hypothetical protein NC653_010742 [Populus alba x Populus x berolinensis]|uniref:Uncharacterized protein n=1 Tax=Populus alba x Populus x berolinensis TaxID=444605 RepID=A0AAD6W5M9_9ROSI|nr:hypothetical protein NC653_010742 [Populus alba x Populus x berolinensis]